MLSKVQCTKSIIMLRRVLLSSMHFEWILRVCRRIAKLAMFAGVCALRAVG